MKPRRRILQTSLSISHTYDDGRTRFSSKSLSEVIGNPRNTAWTRAPSTHLVTLVGLSLLGILDRVGEKVPSLVVLSIFHELLDFLFPLGPLDIKRYLIHFRHFHFVLHGFGMIQKPRPPSSNGMFIIFPVLRLVTLGDLRQRCLTHEDVEVENQQNEGKAANAGLVMHFVEKSSPLEIALLDDHLAAVTAGAGACARAVANADARQQLTPTRRRRRRRRRTRQRRSGGGRQTITEAAADDETAQGTEDRHLSTTRLEITLSTTFVFRLLSLEGSREIVIRCQMWPDYSILR